MVILVFSCFCCLVCRWLLVLQFYVVFRIVYVVVKRGVVGVTFSFSEFR